MIIQNPTKNKIEVKVQGVIYSIEAEGTLENIPEEVARYWQENLHKFIILKKDKVVETKSEKIEVPAPAVEAKIEPEATIEEEVIVPEKEEVAPVASKTTKTK